MSRINIDFHVSTRKVKFIKFAIYIGFNFYEEKASRYTSRNDRDDASMRIGVNRRADKSAARKVPRIRGASRSVGGLA